MVGSPGTFVMAVPAIARRLAAWALTLALTAAYLLIIVVLSIFRRGRHSVVRLHRHEAGAFGLIELMISVVLASFLLWTIGTVADVAEHSAAYVGSQAKAVRGADTALALTVADIADATPLHGCAKYADGSQVPSLDFYNVQPSACSQFAVGQGAIAYASANVNAKGICWYSAQSNNIGLTAPHLRCLVTYQDGTIWSFDWPPMPGAYYTTCAPGSCFGFDPVTQGLPPEPSANSPSSSAASFVGTTASQAPFDFFDSRGNAIDPAPGNLADIYSVELNVKVTYGGRPSTRYYTTYTYQSFVGSAVQSEENSL